MSLLSQSIYQQKQKKDHKKWYVLPYEDVLLQLKTDKNGLDEKEVSARKEKYGDNRLPIKEKETKLNLLLKQFKGSLVYVLLGASAISFFWGDHTNAWVILLAILINVIMGFYQENKAKKSLLALKKIAVNYCKVLRDKRERQIMAEELVPGDVVFLTAGDRVPADMRLIKVNNLRIGESPLTGESIEIEKTHKPLAGDLVLGDQINMAFMGTQVVQGNGIGVVVAIGQETQIGKIASLVSETIDVETPLQKKLSSFAKKLSWAAIIICLFVFLVGVVLGYDAEQIFLTSVAISVAIIPEGLLVVMTVLLAFGIQRILKDKALVKQLLAAETLGSTTVICTDKTGTVTDGEMRVVEINTLDYSFDLFAGEPEDKIKGGDELLALLKIMVLCNNAYIENPEVELEHRIVRGSPTEKALLMAAANLGLEKSRLDKEEPRLEELPFDSAWKYMMTLNRGKEENYTYLKGAPESVLGFSKYIYSSKEQNKLISDTERDFLIKKHQEMSKKGLRVLACGYKKVGGSIKSLKTIEKNDFIFVGFVGLKDPLRPEVKQAIEETKKAGIKTVIITGDHELTARTIARELGLPSEAKNIMSGERLAKLKESELKEIVPEISIYARVAPEDKLKIVRAWQDRGEVVAMTGDGINDAPALKKADIGVAVNSGTDVSKETADIVLLDNNFLTIVKAVKEGRVIFDNIKKVILYFLSDGLAEVIAVGVGMLLGWPLPLLASQIIWINLINDTFPGIAMAKEPPDDHIMSQPPKKPGDSLMPRKTAILALMISIMVALGALFLFNFFYRQTGDIALARTVAFTFLAIKTLLYIFSARNLYTPIWKTNLFNNKYLILALIAGLTMQTFVVYNNFANNIFQTTHIGLLEWLVVILACVLLVGMIELIKIFYYKKEEAK